ncbi:MAG: hypothetical protein PHG06_21905, partial [Parabacteroides sp.]|nr:hypothetical protein [Parabacteroides sp.]
CPTRTGESSAASWTSYGARAGTIDLTKYAVPLRSTAYFVRCSTRVYTIILTRPIEIIFCTYGTNSSRKYPAFTLVHHRNTTA